MKDSVAISRLKNPKVSTSVFCSHVNLYFVAGLGFCHGKKYFSQDGGKNHGKNRQKR